MKVDELNGGILENSVQMEGSGSGNGELQRDGVLEYWNTVKRVYESTSV